MRARTVAVIGSVFLFSVGTVGCEAMNATAKASDSTQAPSGTKSAASTFKNPIMNTGADPWALYSGGEYYLTMTTGTNVTLWASKDLTNISQGTSKVVWEPPSGYQDVWAPELHHIGNRWYIYVAVDKNGDNATHRMYVLESSSDNPMSNYKFMGQITSPDNHWAIDGTVLSLHNQLYFIWSGWQGQQNGPQNLYIAKMSSPTKISSQRVQISSPTHSWETSVAPINEGPEVLTHDGKVFVVYSANASWTNHYCLGMLTLQGTNPMKSGDWVKSPKPVFQSGNNVFGPGHASFTVSPDGKQNWIVYHAARFSTAGWDRNVRTQPFKWGKSGMPDFGTPDPTSQMLQIPSGEPPYATLVDGKVTKQSYTFQYFVSQTGQYKIYVHYSNFGQSTLAPMTVNGQDAYGPYLASTGASDSFQMAVTTANLKQGRNSVVLSLQHLPSVQIDSVWVSIRPVS